MMLSRIASGNAALFHFVMIKPTHYDDDGYPIQWLRSAIPSNTLACLNGLAEDATRRQVLGPGVEIRLHTYDETNRRVRPDQIIRKIRRAGGRALIGLVGVQSNQFPRAVDLARPFLDAGLPVCIGGFHVSGCIAMLPEMPADMRAAQALGISFFAGEAEERRLDEVLRDAYGGTLKPLYNYMDDLPALAGEPPPFLPRQHVRRTSGSLSSIDLGRGCPYQCSFCTIINVQGRKSRFRSPDDLEKIVRENYAQGIKRFFITDDNFARNRDWEPLFDRMIQLRVGEGMKIGFTIQVDTLCHRIPNFIEKATQAGVRRVFIGLENINPDNLIAAKKRQNKITEYREMLQKWRNHGAITYAGYILGFPADTKESILRDIEIIKRELPIDILEFFFLTPLPGSEDHKVQSGKGVWMDPDLNKVRPQPPRLASFEDVGRRMGGGLSRRLAGLLHARACAHDPAPHLRQQDRPAGHDAVDHPVVLPDDPVRGRAPAGRRRVAAEIPPRPAPRPADREPAEVLFPPGCRHAAQDRRLWPGLLAGTDHPQGGSGGPGPLDLYRSRHRAAAGPTNSMRSTSITRPPAARPRWRASAATMRSARVAMCRPMRRPPALRRSDRSPRTQASTSSPTSSPGSGHATNFRQGRIDRHDGSGRFRSRPAATC